MVHVVKVILFAMICVAGFYVIPLVTNLSIMLNVYPSLPDGELVQSFAFWLFTGGIGMWLLASIASVGYFFTRGELRIWLLLGPMYVPAVYGILVITYYNFVKVA
jgi:hypothetical protein